MKSKPAILLAMLLGAITAHAADKPNIIVVLADDLGNADLGSNVSMTTLIAVPLISTAASRT